MKSSYSLDKGKSRWTQNKFHAKICTGDEPEMNFDEINKLGLSCAKLRANLVWLDLVWYRFATFDLYTSFEVFGF